VAIYHKQKIAHAVSLSVGIKINDIGCLLTAIITSFALHHIIRVPDDAYHTNLNKDRQVTLTVVRSVRNFRAYTAILYQTFKLSQIVSYRVGK